MKWCVANYIIFLRNSELKPLYFNRSIYICLFCFFVDIFNEKVALLSRFLLYAILLAQESAT